MSPTASPAPPVRNGSRDGPAAPAPERCCLTCTALLPSARARYCSAACKQRAFRLRQAAARAPALAVLRQERRRRGTLAARTVYECPACGERFVGRQRCPECQLFCRALGLGGTCPECDAVILLAELVELDTNKGGA